MRSAVPVVRRPARYVGGGVVIDRIYAVLFWPVMGFALFGVLYRGGWL